MKEPRVYYGMEKNISHDQSFPVFSYQYMFRGKLWCGGHFPFQSLIIITNITVLKPYPVPCKITTCHLLIPRQPLENDP